MDFERMKHLVQNRFFDKTYNFTNDYERFFSVKTQNQPINKQGKKLFQGMTKVS